MDCGEVRELPWETWKLLSSGDTVGGDAGIVVTSVVGTHVGTHVGASVASLFVDVGSAM